MKRYAAAAVLVLSLASCARDLPDYQPSLTFPSSPISTIPINPPLAASPPQASFFDGFDRPDTGGGLGEGWNLRGPEPSTALEAPAEPAHDGFISDGRFTYAGDNAVSAVRQFRGTVTRIGAIGRWNQTRRGAESTMAIAITPTANLTQAMVHLAVNRSAWELTIRRQGGKSESIARGHFSPILSLNRDYLIEMEVDADNLTVRVPGKAITETVQLDGLLGDYAYWQQYPNRKPGGVVFAFDTVWAAETGQPLHPISQ